MANNSDARRVVVLVPGDTGYEFARKFYLVPAGTVDARRLEQGTSGQAGFERAWRVAIVAQDVNARAGYYVDANGTAL